MLRPKEFAIELKLKSVLEDGVKNDERGFFLICDLISSVPIFLLLIL